MISEGAHEQSSFEKFRPNRAVRLLAQPKSPVIKTWALARLLAWTILDQRTGVRPKRPPDSPASGKPIRTKIRTTWARQAGHITLAYLLDRHLRLPNPAEDPVLAKELFPLFLHGGGFRACFQGWGIRELVYRIVEAKINLEYIYLIIEYMCRVEKYGYGRQTIEGAKFFVEKYMHRDDSTYGVSKISKIWEQYKNAAPYIFATYPFMSRWIDNVENADQIIRLIETLASDQERLDRILGRAAYVAAILNRTVRKVRLKDFKEIEQAVPRLRPFSDEELKIISSFDPQAPIS